MGMLMSQFTIGYTNPGYPVIRTILDKCLETRYVRVRPFGSMVAKVASALRINSLPAIARRIRRCAFTGGISEHLFTTDLMHFFNTIALPPCKKPYVTTFETTVPRSFEAGAMMRKGFRSLRSSQCRRLIALSEHAKLRQMIVDAEYGAKEVDKKITVLLPPQDLLASDGDMLQKSGVLAGGGASYLHCA